MDAHKADLLLIVVRSGEKKLRLVSSWSGYYLCVMTEVFTACVLPFQA